jgi:hypothetical protein
MWEPWRTRPGTLLVLGHDMAILLRDDAPVYIAKR